MAAEAASSAAQSPPQKQSLVKHVVHMPRWHKVVLVLGVVLLAAGVTGQVTGRFSSQPVAPSQTASHSGTATPRGGSAFVGSDSSPEPSPSAESSQADQTSWVDRYSPTLTHVGASFVVGFLLGWVFRAFLKIMSLLAGAALLVLLGLSYFHVINIDMTAAQQQYATAMAWATDQLQRLGQALLSHVPGSSSSLLGLFIGFRRHH